MVIIIYKTTDFLIGNNKLNIILNAYIFKEEKLIKMFCLVFTFKY